MSACSGAERAALLAAPRQSESLADRRAKDEIEDEATTAEVPYGQTSSLTEQVDFETRVSSGQHVYHQTAEGLQTSVPMPSSPPAAPGMTTQVPLPQSVK